ncbi:MAG: tRNA (guanosine(37)-N1)-methyltransferase TrmD [Candidatus Jacksonbacteria bacterium]|nr:tRNA (guanosine(37)-N1)-methyltransferase TrmD [Candidatus Jacksonbacteria bacterium]
MTFHIITIFPNIFDSYINESILKRAQEAGVVTIVMHDLRKYATDKHKTTDDTPTGGGPGMVMKPEPIFNCLKAIREKENPDFKIQKKSKNIFFSESSPILLMTPRGKQFTQKDAQTFASKKLNSVILICGRYEGIDQRVHDYMIDSEFSIGPYVLSGGELPAVVITEAITRLLPGALGNPDSLIEESFSKKLALAGAERSAGEYPQYTKPSSFSPTKELELTTPEILLSGNHEEIKKWRNQHSQ